MTETITIDGKDYEVLTLDRIGEITHAKVSSGAVLGAAPELDEDPQNDVVYLSYEDGTSDQMWASSLEVLGIQPLKLVERVPVSFKGEVQSLTGVPGYLDGNKWVLCPYEVKPGMKFKCFKITEEGQ